MTQFVVDYGYPVDCGRRARGRYPRQISDALKVGRVQVGRGVILFAAYLNTVGGLSYGNLPLKKGRAPRRTPARSRHDDALD